MASRMSSKTSSDHRDIRNGAARSSASFAKRNPARVCGKTGGMVLSRFVLEFGVTRSPAFESTESGGEVTLRMLIWPEASNPQNNIAAVSAEGRTVWVLIRRLNSSCNRSIAFVVLALRHWLGGRRAKVKRRRPSSRTPITTSSEIDVAFRSSRTCVSCKGAALIGS